VSGGDECGAAGELLVRDSIVEDSEGSGIDVEGAAAASVQRSHVRRTRAMLVGDALAYGDGIAAVGVWKGQEIGPASLRLEESLVESSARSGVIYYGGGGEVRRSVLRGNVLAIDLEEAATPTIGDDNVYEGNLENRVTYGNKLAPSPAPKLPPPPIPPGS